MKKYSGYLTFDEQNSDSLAAVLDIAKRRSLDIDLGPSHLEINFTGRDTTGQVVAFLYELSHVIYKIGGEVSCEVVNDFGDNSFEFYKVEEGGLYCQKAEIVRGEIGRVILNL